MLSLLEIGPVVLEKKIFKSVLSIITMWLHLLLEKAVVLHLNNFEFPLPNDAFFQVWFKWFYGRKLKCEDTDRGADNRQQANKKLILSFSSSELKQSKVLVKQKIRALTCLYIVLIGNLL